MAYCDVCSADGAKRYRVGRMKLRLCRLCRPMMADLIRCCDTCLKYDRDGMRCRRTQGHIPDAESMSCAGWQQGCHTDISMNYDSRHM